MSPRLPGRHDEPVTPMEMTAEAILQFQADIRSGYGGQAQWRKEGNHELLDLWLHPDVVRWLPEGTFIAAIGNRYDEYGFVQFRLKRDLDSALVKVVRSGVRKETLRPEGGSS